MATTVVDRAILFNIGGGGRSNAPPCIVTMGVVEKLPLKLMLI